MGSGGTGGQVRGEAAWGQRVRGSPKTGGPGVSRGHRPGTGQPDGKARPHEPRGFQLACANEDTVRPHGPEGEKPHTSKSRVRTK